MENSSWCNKRCINMLFVSFEVSRHIPPPGGSGSPMLTHRSQSALMECFVLEEDGLAPSLSPRSPMCLHILASPTRSYISARTQHTVCLNAAINRYPNLYRISRFDIWIYKKFDINITRVHYSEIGDRSFITSEPIQIYQDWHRISQY